MFTGARLGARPLSPERDSNLTLSGHRLSVGGLGWPELLAPAPTTRAGFMKTTISAIAFGGLIAGMLFTAVPAQAEIKGVVELFTSQGCSSCPPADKMLGQYAQQKDLLALSYNVNYWDYLGWKDTLATADNTQRQRNYTQAQGAMLSTPQAVVDGRTSVTPSKAHPDLKELIDPALAKYSDGLPVHLSLSSTSDAITVHIDAVDPAIKAAMPHATLWLVMYDRSVTVPIRSGENDGKTITYSNVVRKLRPIAMWKGDASSFDLPKSEIKHADVNRCAVLLQEETKDGLPGPILGAATIDMTGT